MIMPSLVVMEKETLGAIQINLLLFPYVGVA